MSQRSAGGERHDVERAISAIAGKLRAKSELLAHAGDHFTIEVFRQGAGYDVKLKTTT